MTLEPLCTQLSSEWGQQECGTTEWLEFLEDALTMHVDMPNYSVILNANPWLQCQRCRFEEQDPTATYTITKCLYKRAPVYFP